jgi:hypothetical protein
MDTIIFKTQDAVFKFNQVDTKKIIISNINKYDIIEAEKLLNQISAGNIKMITIPAEPVYFNLIGIDLIEAGHGSALCKTCNLTYSAGQLKAAVIGAGTTPLTIQIKRKGIIKRMFSKRQKHPSISGGISYLCPENHNLISIITWKLF